MIKTSTFRKLAISSGILLATAAAAGAHINVVTPNGGEVLQAGDTYQIQWTIVIAHNIQNWDVWYSTTGPTGPWIPIALDLPPGNTTAGSQHTYDWTVPNDPSNTVRIRVRMDNNGQNYLDRSDGDFEILAACCGTSYCNSAVPNSSGNPGVITGDGSDAVTDNGLTLTASQLPQNAFGYFLTSQQQGLVVGAGGSQGNLCLSGGIGRYVGPGQILSSGVTGSFDLTLDLSSTPTPTGLVQVMTGETWNYQCWFRDSVGGSATSNFTNAVSVIFQ